MVFHSFIDFWKRHGILALLSHTSGTFSSTEHIPLKSMIGESSKENQALLEFDESNFDAKEYEKKSIEELKRNFKGSGNKWAVLCCTGIMSLLR